MGKTAGRCFGYHDKYCGETAGYHHQKKVWQLTVHEVKKTNPLCNIRSICRLLGYSTQAYHQQQKRVLQKQVHEDLMVQQIHLIRKHQPMCGGRKLFIMLQPFFTTQNIAIGRGAFFDILAKNKILVRPHKRRVSTTNSRHHFRRFPNLAKDFKPMKAHELWVSDIT